MSDFNILLSQSPALAIDERMEQLETKARAALIDVESAKVSTAALMILGAGLSANPLCAVLAGLGAVGYAGAVILDFTSTGQFRPLPVLRKGAGELLATIGGVGRDDDDDIEAAEIETLAGCLPPREGKEFFTLAHHGDRLAAYLQAVPPEQRLGAYRQAVKRPRVLAGVNPTPPIVAQPAAPALPPEPAQKPIGPTTRLTAVEVPASPVEAARYAQASSPADDLARPVQNALVIGKGGSGKGILLSNALRAVRQAEPDRTIYVIDPKADPLEQPYWEGCHCVASKPCRELMPIDVWDWVSTCIREFQSIAGPKLLVIDELRFLSNTFARCNDRQTKALDTFWYIVESFTSLGDAVRSHVWGVSQSSHTADLKISGGTLGQFRVMALVDTKDFGFYDTLTATNIVQKHPDPAHLRDSVAAQSPVHRVYYDSKFRRWFPLPKLPNYSGRDRDAGSLLPLPNGNSVEGRFPTGNQGGSALPRVEAEAEAPGSGSGSGPEAEAEAPGSDAEAGGSERNFRILDDGSAVPTEPLRARAQCYQMLADGETSIKQICTAIFGVSGGRNFSPLSALIKDWIAQWNEMQS